ncbi:MAG TPA: exodeoxyribonuclease VII small subunit [Candidatus Binatia bacterium]|jgi:exodeoxyribonuclease VII small subunit
MGKVSKKGDANRGAPDFEQAMAELEETVRRLDAGELPLEESLATFEKGIALVRALHARLDAAQMRIDELTRRPDGTASLAPLAATARRSLLEEETEVVDEEDPDDEDPEDVR